MKMPRVLGPAEQAAELSVAYTSGRPIQTTHKHPPRRFTWYPASERQSIHREPVVAVVLRVK